MMLVKKKKCNDNIKHIKIKRPDLTNLAANTTLNA